MAWFSGVGGGIAGSELEREDVPDVWVGVMLFAVKRLVIIKKLADNKYVWPGFGDWLARV